MRPLTSIPGMKPCSRCNGLFRATHGNQKLCGACRVGRERRPPSGMTFGVRRCDCCSSEFIARAEHQRFCDKRCQRLGRLPLERALYASQQHRGGRRRLTPLVATGTVRCARGADCLRAELVDVQCVGGFIRPGERWHLGHPDGESAGGPEHVRCNAGAPSRSRARLGRAL